MPLPKTFVLLVLFSSSFFCFGQKKCTNSVEVVHTKMVGQSKAKVELKITGTGSFTGKVFNNSATGSVEVASFAGNNSQKIVIPDLEKSNRYNVVVEFHAESYFLCKTKVLPDILLTDKP